MSNELECKVFTGEPCRMEPRIEEVIQRFGRLAEKLTENQIEIRLNIVKLSENIHDLRRVHGRVDKLEEELKKLIPLIYKMIGVATAVAIAIPVITSVFLK